jgi:hypothetical protein
MLTASLAGSICATDEEDELSVIQHSLLQLSFSSSLAVAAEDTTPVTITSAMTQAGTHTHTPTHSSNGQLQPSFSLSRESQTHKSGTTDHVLLAHHKGGWEMSHQAAVAMAGAADEPDSRIYVNLTHSFAISPEELATPKASCWLHIIRNPFEMIASAYVYHAAGSEGWLFTPFGSVAGRLAESTPAFRHVYEGITQVMDNSISGPLDWLPDPKADENYPQWLRRVDLDDGLLAEAIGPTNKSLSSLEFTDGLFRTESQSCNVDMCFNKFYEDCNASWHQVLNAWQIPENRSHRMHTAVMKSCPDESPQTEKHSSDYKGHLSNFTHPPEHELVQRLRELDRLHLGGRIAEMEKRFNCPVSGKYVGPASGENGF